MIILMGVSGSGETTIGERLAQVLGWPFSEGDQFHPPANVAKRLARRRGHFMPPGLLASQFAALEEPERGVGVDIVHPPETIVALIREPLRVQAVGKKYGRDLPPLLPG